MKRSVVVVTKTRGLYVELDKLQLEHALLEWLEMRSPDTKGRTDAKIEFRTTQDGEVAGACISATVPA